MKKVLIITSVLLVSIVMFLPHNKIETTNKNFNVYIKDGNSYTKQNTGTFPTDGYVLNTEESTCTGGGTLSQNATTKKINLSISASDKCDLYFDPEPATNTITSLVGNADTTSTDVITATTPAGATCTNTLAYDGTSDNNLRYVGADPCNYVTFNSESWRIIGVMNNIDDGTGNTETRIKLIRAASLGNYSWDTSESSVNSGYGVNDWSQADLKNELNGDYLNTSLTANTNWYNGPNNAQTAEYDYTKGLSQAAQSLIGNAKWYLGGASSDQAFNTEGEGTASKFYGYERGTTVWGSTSGQTCNDGACPRSTSWTGKVALAYPSDYGYAVGGESRSTCLGKKLADYENDNCHTSQWLFSDGRLLSPYSVNSYSVFSADDLGLDYPDASARYPAVPAVYLKSSISITGGDGSPTNPYTFG